MKQKCISFVVPLTLAASRWVLTVCTLPTGKLIVARLQIQSISRLEFCVVFLTDNKELHAMKKKEWNWPYNSNIPVRSQLFLWNSILLVSGPTEEMLHLVKKFTPQSITTKGCQDISSYAISTAAFLTVHTFNRSHFQPFTLSTACHFNCMQFQPPQIQPLQLYSNQ